MKIVDDQEFLCAVCDTPYLGIVGYSEIKTEDQDRRYIHLNLQFRCEAGHSTTTDFENFKGCLFVTTGVIKKS